MGKIKLQQKKEFKNELGITLIALVITIIVLLILAAVTIASMVGNNGIVKKAVDAREKTQYGQIKELLETQILGSYDEDGNLSLEKLKESIANNVKNADILNKSFPLRVVIDGYDFSIDSEGKVRDASGDELPIINPYGENDWTYAWTCTNGVWSDVIQQGNPAEGDIVAKFYAMDNKINPKMRSDSGNEEFEIGEGTEYHLVIDGVGEMGDLVAPTENGSENWFAWEKQFWDFGESYDPENTPEEIDFPVILYTTKIIICDGVTNIPIYAFAYACALNNVVLPNTIETMAMMNFYNCYELKSFTVPESVTSMVTYSTGTERTGLGPFAYTGIEDITILNGMTKIEDWAFVGANELRSITIPDSVTSIGTWAFAQCQKLENIQMPSNLKEIGAVAFGGCFGLTSIDIPDTVTTIGYNAFSSCKNLKNINLPNDLTTISDYAFSNCEELIEVIIPENVKTIGKGAFYQCEKLENINFNNGLITIGESAFSKCSALKEVDIADSVTEIGKSTFESCTSLENIELPSGLTIIPDSMFSGCSSLNEIIIPSSIVEIKSSAFSGCTSLSEIDLPANLEIIGGWAFSNCTGLNSLTLPNSVNTIGYSAFNNVPHIYYYGEATGSPWGALAIN